eukprot:TRINITY_DN14267_c0_g1_i1.p1 TRINITY_DN14267_c0_g1~~TRINITY_DN14267_c0_g1_i1.p1  ORF type:complete len:236 (+),score=44.97 TRINITY_DN14267_c0_g1_i1:41-709(+)
MAGRVVVVTGANQGIGLELCRLLKARGDTVYAACRKSSAELDQLNVNVCAGVDVSDDSQVQAFASKLAGVHVDILINNAGILTVEALDSLNFDAMRQQFEVNSIGPLRVTAALLPSLRSGSKVIIITSRMGSIADNGSGSYYGYRMSKAAVNAAGVSLARDLKPRGIAVALLHPGMVATRMTSGKGITSTESATGLLTRVDELTVETSGCFRHGVTGETLPW